MTSAEVPLLSPSIILAAITVYMAGLVAIAWRADRPSARRPRPAGRRLLYGLSLATLCSSWTYFGALGEARDGSWLYFANSLGPMLAVTAGFPLWRRVALLSKQENVGSLADFLAARYGKSRALGSLVAGVSTLGALPYLALQQMVLTRVWVFATGASRPRTGQALVLTLVLAGIAILFGTRRPSLTQHSRGLVSMVAVEACVKLAGLLSVAGFCWCWAAPAGERQPWLRCLPSCRA